MNEVSLRPAANSDFEFVYQIKKATLRSYVDRIWGWDEAQQRERHKNKFDPIDMYIVLYRGEQVGVLAVTVDDTCVFVGLICIDPKYQHRGLGSFLMRQQIEQAKAKGISIRLRVLRPNPAFGFYQGLGFIVSSEDEFYFHMEKPA